MKWTTKNCQSCFFHWLVKNSWAVLHFQGRSDSNIFTQATRGFKRMSLNVWHKPVRMDTVFKPGDVRNSNVFFSNFTQHREKITSNPLSFLSGKKKKERKRKKLPENHQKRNMVGPILENRCSSNVQIVLHFHRFEIGRSTLHE